MGEIYQVRLLGVRGEKFSIYFDTQEQMESMTVLQLEEKIAQVIPEFDDLPPLRLMYAGKSLDLDEKTLSHYGIQDVSYSDGA